MNHDNDQLKIKSEKKDHSNPKFHIRYLVNLEKYCCADSSQKWQLREEKKSHIYSVEIKQHGKKLCICIMQTLKYCWTQNIINIYCHESTPTHHIYCFFLPLSFEKKYATIYECFDVRMMVWYIKSKKYGSNGS